MTEAVDREKGGPSGSAGRRNARRTAMMVLYKADILELGVDDSAIQFEAEHELELSDYARDVIAGVAGMREQLDATIQSHLAEWTLDRLGAVERNILRLSTWELETGTVPKEIAIDEAVELAKRYASPEAAKLINGVLGNMVRQEEKA
jgi:N utilization substance protein B